MPRQAVPGKEIKRRSRTGCHACKEKKIRCDETHPTCNNCQKHGRNCDYSIRLVWGGRPSKKQKGEGDGENTLSFPSSGGQVGGQFNFSAGMGTIDFGAAPTSHPTISPPPRSLQLNETDSARSFSDRGSLTPQGSFGIPVSGIVQDLRPGSSPSINPTSSPSIDPLLFGQDGQPWQRPNSGHTYLAAPYQGHSRTLSAPQQIPLPLPPSSYPTSTYNPAQSLQSSAGSALLDAAPSHHRSQSFNSSQRPYPTPSPTFATAYVESRQPEVDRPAKRARNGDYPGFHRTDELSKGITPQGPMYLSPRGVMPNTPSSYISDDLQSGYQPEIPTFAGDTNADGSRRLSVESLLAGPPGDAAKLLESPTTASLSESSLRDVTPVEDFNTETEPFGYDYGEPDMDIQVNNLNNTQGGAPKNAEIALISQSAAPYQSALLKQAPAFQPGGYYYKAVEMRIPRSLLPLPDYLLKSPTNLLYFHHFLNHTAKVLSPHDCLRNPFRTLMPQMAVANRHLLNLLLAYSASHRARLLEQPEPSSRMSIYLDDAFRSLRLALADDVKRVSNSNLATAIMLCSLEIISPIPFAQPVPWQAHLKQARDIILVRGQDRAASKNDKVFHFLCRWFAYLDILGSLSGQKEQPLFSGSFWTNYPSSHSEEFEIDCLLGFTSRCIGILARVAQLARKCDEERKNFVPEHSWTPDEETKINALRLLGELEEARTHVVSPCNHQHYTDENMPAANEVEMRAMNEAFHWAGLVHLHRRVLGKKSSHGDVQSAVKKIVEALEKISIGGTAEAGLLFPIFTAGCDAVGLSEKNYILARVESMEKSGLTQVVRARKLMQRVWETGLPWETLVRGEFIG